MYKKTGRNDPCYCGSGKKYKKCHLTGDKIINSAEFSAAIRKEIIKHNVSERNRAKQQGLGRPIISDTVGKQRVIAVKNKIYFSEKFRTFHDFLQRYIV